MATLIDSERQKVLGQLSRSFAWVGLTKPDVQAAVNAADDWADANAGSFNSALPLPFRTSATQAQKALVLAYICMRRAGQLKVEGE